MSKFKVFIFYVGLLIVLSSCGLNGPTEGLNPIQTRGLTIFNQYCAACHDNQGDTIIVGPPLSHIATFGGDRVSGKNAETYIRQSLIEPDAYFVDGFDDLMPKTFNDILAQEEIESLIEYLLTLK